MKPASPSISVILPVYNAAAYVEIALASILGQSFSDFECIVINDGSTDGSTEILDRIAASDNRVRLVHRSNQGYSRCLNQALGMVRAPLLARMDADDESLPHRFALQVAFLAAHPEVVAVSGQWIRIDPVGRVLSEEKYLPVEHDAIIDELFKGFGVLPHPGVMMRADAVRQVGGYRVEFEPAEDLDLWLRLSDLGRLANLDEHIIRYRLHSGATSSARREEQRESARRAVVEAYVRREQAAPENFVPALSRTDNQAAVFAEWSRLAMASGHYRTAVIYATKACLAGSTVSHRGLFCDIVRYYRAGRHH
ncbi:MAG: glycosyltransferase [Puniceicoccaceae bacterium]|nr:MAG: glycosyltransferase [Puniceicoccaceae bacterium]